MCILLSICLSVFLFWLICTLIAWTTAFIPILKNVFVPWYRLQCQFWTENKQQRRSSVAFFHPNWRNDTGEERILWTLVRSILEKSNDEVHVIIYTANDRGRSEEIFQSIKQYFDADIDVHSSLQWIFLGWKELWNSPSTSITYWFYDRWFSTTKDE